MFNLSEKKYYLIHNKTFWFWLLYRRAAENKVRFTILSKRHLPLTCDMGVTWFNSLLCLGGLERIAYLWLIAMRWLRAAHFSP